MSTSATALKESERRQDGSGEPARDLGAGEAERQMSPTDAGLLSVEEQERLLMAAAQTGRGRRDVAVILLGLKAGMHAGEQCRVEMRHVSVSGAASYILVPGRRVAFDPALPPHAVPIPMSLATELEALMAWRRERCEHGDGRYGKHIGPDGAVLCHACRQPLDFGRTPLLQRRAGGRLSERQIHKIFAKLRRRAGIDDRHTIGALVRTYDRHLRALLTRAVRMEI